MRYGEVVGGVELDVCIGSMGGTDACECVLKQKEIALHVVGGLPHLLSYNYLQNSNMKMIKYDMYKI